MASTNNLPTTALADSFLVNWQGSSRKMSTADVAALLGNGGSGTSAPLVAEIEQRRAQSQAGDSFILTVDEGGTANAITATKSAEQAELAIGTGKIVALIWPITNTAADPTVTINTTTLTVRRRNGDAIEPGELVGGRLCMFFRASTHLRLLSSGGISDTVGLQAALSALTAQIQAEVEARAKGMAATSGLSAPGDDAVVVQDAAGKPLLGVDSEGYTYAEMRVRLPGGPGDYIASLVEDMAGNILLGFDIRDGSIFPQPALSAAAAPGDFIVPLILNADGSTALGIDLRDGTPYPLPEISGGAAVSFVDPDNLGDAWNSIRTEDDHGEVIRYLSRQWREAWGYEKRGNITLAQTPDPAIGILHFGGGSGAVVRPLADDFPFHMVNEQLIRPEDGQAASAAAVAWLEGEYAARRGLPTVLALTQVVGSTVEADALAGSAPRNALRAKVVAAREALAGWGKDLFVDRIGLALLEGAPTTGQATADLHYAAVAASLRAEIAEAAGQIPMPVVVVSQSAGTRSDGTSPVILAEGNLDWAHWSLGLIVATPKYPFPLQPGSPATLTPAAALMVSELEALAASERLAARDWYGPTMGAQCSRVGAVITVPFTAMSALILRDPAQHGFAVDGVSNGATISSVAVSGTNVLITMSAAPTGTLTVRYAWGQTGDQGDGYPANRGALTDSWSQPSRMVSGATLYRYARSGRAPVV